METHRLSISKSIILQAFLPALATHILFGTFVFNELLLSFPLWFMIGFGIHAAYCLRIYICWKKLMMEDTQASTNSLQLASFVTAWRGGLLTTALTGVFVAQSGANRILLTALLFLFAILLDALDGYLARRLNQQTSLGAMLDTETDGYAMLTGTILAYWQGLLSVEFLSAGLAYYLFIIAANSRKRSGLEVHNLIPGSFRRTIAGFMMGFIAVVLSGVFSEHAVHIVGRIYLLFFIVLFIFDWLTVSGRLRHDNDLIQIARALLTRGIFDMVPLVLRAALCFVVIIAFKGQEYYTVYLVLSLSITAGILSRTLAVLLMLLLGWHLTISGASPFADLALAYTATIALLGAGTFAIWQPEEKWINR